MPEICGPSTMKDAANNKGEHRRKQNTRYNEKL
jgi:hypothetical protein